jgi:hypothetical protein
MIKKVLSITSIVLMLTAMLHFSVATHYCGGMIASSEVSLSGKLATCEMEQFNVQLPVNGLTFASHCCENVIRYYGINGNYFPSFISIPQSFQPHSQTFELPENLFRNSFAAALKIPTSESPPDPVYSSFVELSDICTYRI